MCLNWTKGKETVSDLDAVVQEKGVKKQSWKKKTRKRSRDNCDDQIFLFFSPCS